MKNKLPIISLFNGVLSWVVCIVGITHFEKFNFIGNENLLSMLHIRTYESVIILLCVLALTGGGFILGICSLKLSERRKISWAAILINGVYFIPMAGSFVQVLIPDDIFGATPGVQ